MKLLSLSLILSEREFALLEKRLPRRGVVLLDVDGKHLPISRRSVRVFRLGDGNVRIEPLGRYADLWRYVLGIGAVQVHSSPMAKAMRSLEVFAVYGPGVSLGLEFVPAVSPDRFRRGTMARRYIEAARASGATPHWCEVGVPRSMLARLARRFALSPELFAALAAEGEILVLLRRMPLTDPKTGFIIVKPVVIDSAVVHGDVLYLPPDVPIVLFGDEDGDRYYLDVAAVRLSGVRPAVESARGALVGDVAMKAPDFLSDPESFVKHTGLHGVGALAGVLAAQGVGPLFNVMHRVAAGIKLAGYPKEALLVLSALSRVLEPLFDARKRLVSPRVVARDEDGTPVLGYTLPYIQSLIEALRSSSLAEAARVLGVLAERLLADEDEDARATGEVVQEAVDVMNSLPGHIAIDAGGYEVMSAVDAMAFSTSTVLMREPIRQPVPAVRDEVDESGGGGRPVDGWDSMTEREIRHQFGFGGSFPLRFDEKTGRLTRRCGRALSYVVRDLMSVSLLTKEQVAPLNNRDREAFEAGGFPFALDLQSMEEIVRDWERLGFSAEPGVLSEDRGDGGRSVLEPVLLEDGETIQVFFGNPMKHDKGVMTIDPEAELMDEESVRSDTSVFKVGLGQCGGWYRWHLLMLVAEKRRGISVTGKTYYRVRYRLVSVYASPWFEAEPSELVSGCRIRSSSSDRVEWLPGRFDVVARLVETSLDVRFVYLTPQVSLLAAMLGAVLWRVLGVSGSPDTLYDVFMRSSQAVHPVGVEAAVRVQRDVRDAVRRLAGQALELRTEYSEPTARRVTLFGELVKASLVYAGVSPLPDVALHRFNQLVTKVLSRLFGSDRWYPRKGGQNRIIAVDITDASAWSEILAYGGQEWYRFVRETPGLMAVRSSVHAQEAVVQELTVAFVDGLGWIQPSDGKSSSETAYISASSVQYVEQERSQLVRVLIGTDDPFALVRERLLELESHGFQYLRGADGGLVPIAEVIRKGLAGSGAAYRRLEFNISQEDTEVSVQFWAVSQVRPAGAKVVLLDGMVKSFAAVVEDEWYTEDGVKIDAVFSGISLRKKQAWGLVLNGLARMQSRDSAIDAIWEAYRCALVDGKTETQAMLAAFSVARDHGVEFAPVTVVRDGRALGEALVVRVKAVFVDDTAIRDDDPDEAGFNGTVLFSADLVGVPYESRFIDSSAALELNHAVFAVRGLLELPVIRLDDDGDGGDDGGDGVDPSGGPVEELDLNVDDAERTVDLGLDLDVVEESEDAERSVTDAGSCSEGSSDEGDGDFRLVPPPFIVEEESDLKDDDEEDMDDDEYDDEAYDPEEITDMEYFASRFYPSVSPSLDVCLIVGTRHPTEEMERECRRVAMELASQGVIVMSGGADGIDTVAVRSALEVGGSTLTVLPWERSYPYGRSVVQRLDGEDAEEKRRLVMEYHPAPHRLTEGAVKLHMRNAEMVIRLAALRARKKEFGLMRRYCVMFAFPRWEGDVPVGGTAMAIRLAKEFGVPCRAFHPERGWEWLVPLDDTGANSVWMFGEDEEAS